MAVTNCGHDQLTNIKVKQRVGRSLANFFFHFNKTSLSWDLLRTNVTNTYVYVQRDKLKKLFVLFCPNKLLKLFNYLL